MKLVCPFPVLAAVLLASAAPLAAAPPGDDPFADTNRALRLLSQPGGDPFADANRAKAPGKANREPGPDGFPVVGKPGQPDPTANLIRLSVSVTPQEARPGQTVRVTFRGTPTGGYHTYPLTQRAPEQPPDSLTRLTYAPSPGLEPLWPVTESRPEFRDTGVGIYLEHDKPFTWSQDILILPDAKPGKTALRGAVTLQACNESSCTPFARREFEVPVTVAAGPAVPLGPALEARRKEKRPDPAVVPLPGGPGAKAPPSAEAAPPPDRGAAASAASRPKPPTDLLAFVLQGILWGALSLVTPCVFPMIPITVSFFLKQSEKQHHRALTLASVYSGTIVVVLTIAGLALIRVLQPLSQHWATNLVLGTLFLVFALSLFGMFEITLPTWLSNLTSTREGRGGLAGTMFMAMTFTIISFSCVAPFYGSFISLTASAQSAADWLKLSLGALAYSATFASPFFVLALFPALLRSMPRSGSWMNTFKVVMGFLEVAAAFKFLRSAELTLLGKADFLTYDLVLGVYVALSFLCGLYLLGLYRLPHDYEVPETLGVPRLMFSLAFLALGLYLMPGLFKQADGRQQRPRGEVFAWLDSFLLPDVTEEEPPGGQAAAGRDGSGPRLTWLPTLQQALKQADDEKKLVFIDFTGLN